VLFQSWKGRCAGEAGAASAAAAANSLAGLANATSGVGAKVDGTTSAVNGLGGKLDAITNAINNKPVGGGSGEQSSCGPGDESCAGAATGQPGDYVTADPKTVGEVVSNFKIGVQAVPILSAANGFFTFTGGNSCPVWTVPATDYWDTLTFDAHCSGALANALSVGGTLLLAVYAFAAFKWAML
jgi:hypothetical protein